MPSTKHAYTNPTNETLCPLILAAISSFVFLSESWEISEDNPHYDEQALFPRTLKLALNGCLNPSLALNNPPIAMIEIDE